LSVALVQPRSSLLDVVDPMAADDPAREVLTLAKADAEDALTTPWSTTPSPADRGRTVRLLLESQQTVVNWGPRGVGG